MIEKLKKQALDLLVSSDELIIDKEEYNALLLEVTLKERYVNKVKQLENIIKALELKLEAYINQENKDSKLLDLGIDPSKISTIADLRKAVYKETDTTKKLKKLEAQYNGEISLEAAKKELDKKQYMTAAFIARKLEENEKTRLYKTDTSTKPSNKVAKSNI